MEREVIGGGRSLGRKYPLLQKPRPWGYDSNLLLGYFCDLAQKREIHLDETELSLAEWVDYRDIPDDPEGLSLTREMMITFREAEKTGAQSEIVGQEIMKERIIDLTLEQ